MTASLTRDRRVALSMAASWLGQRFFRTFRPDESAPEGDPFDARLRQRERAIGVSIAALWDDGPRPQGADILESLVASDLEGSADEGGYVLWVPPGAALPAEEPYRSDFRLLVGRGLAGLERGERREIRIPVVLRLARIEDDGAYVMVTGALSTQWTTVSEGVRGVFHLDARALHRLPDEPAELDIIVSRVRDRAAVLQPQEVTDIHVHDYWTVSRLPADEPPGLTLVAASAAPEAREIAEDGIRVRRGLRRAVRRATEQRESSGGVDYCVLVLLDAIGHMNEELVTSALRGMSATNYQRIDQVVLVGDGQVREILQPRSLPWQS